MKLLGHPLFKDVNLLYFYNGCKVLNLAGNPIKDIHAKPTHKYEDICNIFVIP